jgi:hypothetical protein
MERGVIAGGLLVAASFLFAVMLNRSAVEEARAPRPTRAPAAGTAEGGTSPALPAGDPSPPADESGSRPSACDPCPETAPDQAGASHLCPQDAHSQSCVGCEGDRDPACNRQDAPDAAQEECGSGAQQRTPLAESILKS